jgi:hypothetical protein
LVVNSPIEAPVLVERVRNDWGRADAQSLRAALLEDIHATNQPKGVSQDEYTERFVDPALARLRLYFPDAYNSLAGADLQKRKAFEKREQERRRSSNR